MSFQNSHLLPLLLVALLPLILHLIDRRRARIVDWPALRFIVLGSRARIRRLQIREALLILLRSLLVLAIACALLRPVSRTVQTSRKRSMESRGVVLVIDTSFSMEYHEEPQGPSALEKAKDAALEVLDGLVPGDRVVIIAGKPERGEAILDLDAARRSVRDLAARSGSFRLLPALDAAGSSLQSMPASAREVYVFTDLQASMLPEKDPARWRFVGERLRARGSRPVLRLIDCGAAQPRNLFLSSLDAAALAAGTDEPTTFRVTIDGPRQASAEAVSIHLLVDGDLVATATAAEVPALLDLSAKLSRSGEVRIAAEGRPDGLSQDDVRHLVLDVSDRLDVLIVGKVLEDGRRGGASYVDLALVPRTPGQAEPPVIFRTHVEEDLPSSGLSRYRVVIFASPARIDEAMAAALEGFVKGGGGLLVFADRAMDLPSWSQLVFRGGHGILPASLSHARAGMNEERRPRDISTSHPVFSVFASPEDGDLSRILVRRWTGVAELSRDAQVLARLDAESPWIIEKRSGLGKAILVTTSATPQDSDLPLTPLFLPLLHRTTRYLSARDAASSNVLVGEEISVPLESGDLEAHVVDPRGKRTALPALLQNDGLRAGFCDTQLPGFYEIEIERPQPHGEAVKISSRIFAVNLPPEESRLDRLSEETLAEIREALGLECTRDIREAASISVTQEVKVEHWPMITALAVALLFAETLLAGTFARGRVPWKIEDGGDKK